MIGLRSRYRMSFPDPAHLMMETRPSRRLGFLLAFLVLATAMAVGFDPHLDLQGGRLFMTLAFGVLALGCLWSAIKRRSIVFDRRGGRIELRNGWGKTVTLATADVEAVCLQKLVLRRRSSAVIAASPPDGEGPRVPTNTAPSTDDLCKLSLEVCGRPGEGRREPLEQSSLFGELDTIGRQIAQFLSVPYRVEVI